MKLIPLGKSLVSAMVDDEDYEKVSRYNWHIESGYVRQSGQKNRLRLHRFIVQCPRNLVVDHIDGNKLNNRRSNLRICTQSNNAKNQIFTKKPYGYKGVYRNKKGKGYMASISVNYRTKYLGYFSTAKKAAKAYNDAAIKYRGKYAALNSI